MNRLADLQLKTSYRKGRDDVANDFYLPVMYSAVRYDRAVGYFRSSIFIIAWTALRGFVSRGGRIRILCSQFISSSDVAALQEGYSARTDKEIAEQFQEEVAAILSDPVLAEPARILAALVARNIVDLKVAILRPAAGASQNRVFHDKVGILRDQYGSTVAFKGSMNETWGGLADGGNLESVDVFCDWVGGRDAERVSEEKQYFEILWENHYPGLDVIPFPDLAHEALTSAAPSDWESRLENLLEQAVGNGAPASPSDSKGRRLKQHQAEGLEDWRAHGRRGILAFVTGAGKTFTALHAIRESIANYGETPIVIVPDKLLFKQWYEELRPLAEELGIRILRAGAGYNSWRDVLRTWTGSKGGRQLVLATNQTARSPEFRNRITKNSDLFLVADEVHRLGSPTNRSLLDGAIFGPRLGLSATPERAGDSTGTAAILNFFDGVRYPRYTLADAVRDGVLTPYFYRPEPVSLSDSEAAEWENLTKRIIRRRAQLDDSADEDSQLDLLYFERARVVKKASAKIAHAVSVIQNNYVHGQRWLVYCEDTEQLDAVRSALLDSGYATMPYYSAMDSDKDETLRWLSKYSGIVAAIRCLDEGVDIPTVTHALILASSKNPREFIQRRGRVLRRAENKTYAYVHDAIVVPPRTDSSDEPDPITLGELGRAIEFAQGAANPPGIADLTTIAVDAGVDLEALAQIGLEDHDNE